MGSIVKSAKNLNATPGKSILGLWLTYAYQYRVDPPKAPIVACLAPSPHAADQSDDHDLWDCIPLFKEDSS